MDLSSLSLIELRELKRELDEDSAHYVAKILNESTPKDKELLNIVHEKLMKVALAINYYKSSINYDK